MIKWKDDLQRKKTISYLQHIEKTNKQDNKFQGDAFKFDQNLIREYKNYLISEINENIIKSYEFFHNYPFLVDDESFKLILNSVNDKNILIFLELMTSVLYYKENFCLNFISNGFFSLVVQHIHNEISLKLIRIMIKTSFEVAKSLINCDINGNILDLFQELCGYDYNSKTEIEHNILLDGFLKILSSLLSYPQLFFLQFDDLFYEVFTQLPNLIINKTQSNFQVFEVRSMLKFIAKLFACIFNCLKICSDNEKKFEKYNCPEIFDTIVCLFQSEDESLQKASLESLINISSALDLFSSSLLFNTHFIQLLTSFISNSTDLNNNDYYNTCICHILKNFAATDDQKVIEYLVSNNLILSFISDQIIQSSFSCKIEAIRFLLYLIIIAPNQMIDYLTTHINIVYLIIEIIPNCKDNEFLIVLLDGIIKILHIGEKFDKNIFAQIFQEPELINIINNSFNSNAHFELAQIRIKEIQDILEEISIYEKIPT